MVNIWLIYGYYMVNMVDKHGGFHSHGGTPNFWMVFVREIPIEQLDDDWGYPYFWKPPYWVIYGQY